MALACVALAMALFGCPGSIADPAEFLGAGDGATAAGDGAAGLPCGLPESCGGSACHGGSRPAAELDLESPRAAERLLDVPSVMCEGRVLVDSAHPERSFLLEKVASREPECGARMPFVGDGLSREEVACLEALIAGWVAGSPADAGAGR
jgi:hypothetical protein